MGCLTDAGDGSRAAIVDGKYARVGRAFRCCQDLAWQGLRSDTEHAHRFPRIGLISQIATADIAIDMPHPLPLDDRPGAI
jgi:hypothetical protein